MKKNKLSIVTVGYKNYQEILNTINSIDSQTKEPFENLLILKGLSETEKNILKDKYNYSYRSFLFDVDNSIFNAMNIGIQNAHGDYVLFLNSGDYFYSKNSIELIINNLSDKDSLNYSFKTLQTYENLNIIRDNDMRVGKKFLPPPHQGFVAPLDKKFFFNEKLKVSADNDWMYKHVKMRKTIKLQDILCVFQLGGQSTYPYLSTVYLFFRHESFNSLFKTLIKFFISLFFSKKEYYKFIARRRSFKYFENE